VGQNSKRSQNGQKMGVVKAKSLKTTGGKKHLSCFFKKIQKVAFNPWTFIKFYVII